MIWSEVHRIGDQLFTRGGISTITNVHRTGALLIGDASVVVELAAPYRDTAYRVSGVPRAHQEQRAGV